MRSEIVRLGKVVEAAGIAGRSERHSGPGTRWTCCGRLRFRIS